MMKCSVCDKRFGGERSFEKHRVGRYELRVDGVLVRPNTRRCLEEHEMLAAFAQNAKGVWSYAPWHHNPYSVRPSAATEVS